MKNRAAHDARRASWSVKQTMIILRKEQLRTVFQFFFAAQKQRRKWNRTCGTGKTMKNKKRQRIIAGVIAIVIILAMVVTTIIGAFL